MVRKKVLIAEDDRPLREALAKKVSDSGYEVVEAINGTDAISKFKSENPDLILLDIIMPGKSGFEVLEEIRIKYHSQIPVIITSNLDQKTDMEIGKNLGVFEYITKANISLKYLILKIHEALPL